MEKNQQKATEYIKVAENFLWEGDIQKAEQKLLIAQKIHPTKKAKDLLDSLQGDNISKSSTSQKRDPRKQPKVLHKKRGCTAENEREYTQEQVDAVRRVKKSNDYYKILGVGKFASNNEIKRAYKQRALQFHPDKNKAPGAAEAFKKIGTVKSILSDMEKRMQYDLFASAAETLSTQKTYDRYPRDIWADIGADGTFSKRFSSSSSGDKQQAKTVESNTRQNVLLMTLPIALVVIFYLLSCWVSPDPLYSLSLNSQYSFQRKTLRLRVPYYVKENFQFQTSRFRLERVIEEEYLGNLRQACYRERDYKEYLSRQAKYGSYKREKYLTAKKDTTPSYCELLKNLESQSGYSV